METVIHECDPYISKTDGDRIPYWSSLVTKQSLQGRHWDSSNQVAGQGFNRNSQATQSIAKTIDYSPQTGSQFPLLKTAPTQFIEYGKVGLVLRKKLHPHILVSMTQTGTLQATMKEK